METKKKIIVKNITRVDVTMPSPRRKPSLPEKAKFAVECIEASYKPEKAWEFIKKFLKHVHDCGICSPEEEKALAILRDPVLDYASNDVYGLPLDTELLTLIHTIESEDC